MLVKSDLPNMAENNTTGTLFTNGRIFVKGESGLHGKPSFAESMLVKDGVVAAVGTQSDIGLAFADQPLSIIDLKQKTILPGFIDGHMHLLLLGQSLCKLSLGKCKSLADIRAAIKEYAIAEPDVPRILCSEWMHSMTPEGPLAKFLDDLDPRPIFIDSKDLHSTWCNSAAIKEMKLEHAEDPAGGKIHRDENGRPSGLLSEGAILSIVWPFLASVSTMEDREDAIMAAVHAYNASGYTGLVEMAMDGPAWDSLISARKKYSDFPMRIAAYWVIKPAGDIKARLAQVEEAIALKSKFNEATSPDLQIVGIKVVTDGIIDGCTAYLSEPYSDVSSPPPLWSREDLEPIVQAADKAGLQVALHAIGDGAITMAVDTLAKFGTRGRRHRIEHLELSSPTDAKRLGELEITASVQPVHADPAILRAWPRLLGPHRCKRAFAYREFADGGARLALGSDSPTAPWDPLKNAYVATTRRSAREPEYEVVVNEEFKLGVCESVVAGTFGAASSVFADKRVGSLEVGKKADFVIVDMEWEAGKLLTAKIEETYFEGRKVWQKE